MDELSLITLAAAKSYTDEHGGGGGGTSNYNDLSNKPQIGGNTLVGNKTASDLGLVAAEAGKGLSTNDYTNADKAIVGGVTAALADKADKSAVKNEFIGTTDEWNALTTEQKKAYDTYQITDDFISSSGSGGDGLQLYHETYTGTGTAAHVLSLQHTPVLITSVGRADGKVTISPFSPKGLAARVDWIIPNTGTGTVRISEDDGVKITGVDAGQACNTEDIEYDVYYLA